MSYFGYIADTAETAEEKEERSYGTLMMARVTGSEGGRIDHVLQVRIYTHHSTHFT